MTLRAELEDLFPSWPFGQRYYNHRVYKNYKYDDAIRSFLCRGDGHVITDHIFAAQFDMPWLKSYKRQFWFFTPLSDKSAILKCKNRAGAVVYYRYFDGAFSNLDTNTGFVLSSGRLRVLSSPLYRSGISSLIVSKYAMCTVKNSWQDTDIVQKKRRA